MAIANAAPVTAAGTAPTVPPAALPSQTDRGTVRYGALRLGRWKSSGVAKVDGDVSVGRADLRGTVVVGGALRAGILSARGTLDARGPVAVTASADVSGSVWLRNGLRAGAVTLRGDVEAGGELSSDQRLLVRGSLRATSIRAPMTELHGVARVTGLIEATTFDGRFVATSELGSIRARTARLRGPVPNVVRWALGLQATVTVERVEAESVVLQGVRAAFVRAKEITLGPAAHLLAHEGTVVRAHRTSRQGPESWTPAPTGLRR